MIQMGPLEWIGVIILFAFFGRKTLKELYRNFFAAKKDFEDVKKEFKTTE